MLHGAVGRRGRRGRRRRRSPDVRPRLRAPRTQHARRHPAAEDERRDDGEDGATHPHHASDARGRRVRAGAERGDLLESHVVSDDAAAARAEWRAEAEDWSRAALEHWEHGRELVDVLRDCMHRGDMVTVAFPTVTWSGLLSAVGIDIARVDAGDTRVEIQLTPHSPFVVRTRAGVLEGTRGDTTATTFTARLRELDGTAVCIGTPAGALDGALRLGRDQLRLTDRDGGCSYVPTGSVWWVRPLDDD